jgi:hypothetical protein
MCRAELKESLGLHQDHMRNLSGAFGTDGPLVMLDAHLDEVGLIVQAIKPDGTMRLLTLGRMAPEAVAASSFRIRTDQGHLYSGGCGMQAAPFPFGIGKEYASGYFVDGSGLRHIEQRGDGGLGHLDRIARSSGCGVPL